MSSVTASYYGVDRVLSFGESLSPRPEPGRARSTPERLARLNLSDRLARQIQLLIEEREYQRGDRLPSIREIARMFGVGHPTVREALKKLETVGVVRIRPGSGIHVGRPDPVLVMATPDYEGGVTRKLLLDLVDARIPMEMQSAALAARLAAPADLVEMRRLLSAAGAHLEDVHLLNSVSMAFHGQIGVASGNAVLGQLLEVLRELFAGKQRLALGIAESRVRDHHEHVQILEALERRNEGAAAELMRAHLEGVREALLRWEPPVRPAQPDRIPA